MPITLEQPRPLPPTIGLMAAARMLGIGRTKAYQRAKADDFPCKVIRIGEGYRVTTADLLRVLGVDPDDG
ncbi:hypothetical protein GCM10027570_06940 [Streptomonospora sediminis]